jgi:Bacterial regulatory helix-turn-helix proteins, AraC family
MRPRFWDVTRRPRGWLPLPLPCGCARAREVLQLRSHPMVGWPDAHPGLFGLRSIQVATIRTGGDPQSGDVLSCEDYDVRAKYRLFQSDPKAMETIVGEIGERPRGGRIFQIPFICDASLGRLFLKFHTEMDSKPFALESASLLREFVSEMILRYGNRAATTLKLGNERWAVKQVKDCLESRYAENLTLEELARVANLSRFYLVRVFRKEVGLPPHAYQTRVRLQRCGATA